MFRRFWPLLYCFVAGLVFNLALFSRIFERNLESTFPEQLASQEMRRRLQTMRSGCSRHGLDLRDDTDNLRMLYPWEFVVAQDNEPKLVWCNVFKAGSTSISYVLNRLAGHSDWELRSKSSLKTPPITMVRNHYGRVSSQRLEQVLSEQNTISFIVARNPFERLVSAYRDKVYNAIRGSYHDKVARKIVKQYRLNNNNNNNNDDDNNKNHNKRSGRKKHVDRTLQSRPTFPEFVDFVLDKEQQLRSRLEWPSHSHNSELEHDMHWAPVYSFCNPCAISFTHILHTETLDSDLGQLLSQANLQFLIPEMRHENRARNGSRSRDLTQDFISQLNNKQREGLCQMYRVDFHIFGYHDCDSY